MSDELKGVLAVALPVGFLLIGAMVIYGPGAKIEGAELHGRRRRRSTLGYPSEKHAELAEDKRQESVEMMSKALRSLTQRKCNTAVLQVAQAQRKAGEAYAHAEDHVPDRSPFYRLEEDLGRMTATVAKTCRSRASDLGAASRDPRIYRVFFTEPLHSNQLISARVVSDKRLSRAELKAIIVERGSGASDLTITKVESERLD